MKTIALTKRSSHGRLDVQIRRGKAVLRELRDVLEDLEDRRELTGAKKRNQGKPGTPWKQAAKELGI